MFSLELLLEAILFWPFGSRTSDRTQGFVAVAAHAGDVAGERLRARARLAHPPARTRWSASRAGLALLVVSNEFTALKMVTATHAVRVLLPIFDEQRFASRKLWQAAAPVPAADRFEALRY